MINVLPMLSPSSVLFLLPIMYLLSYFKAEYSFIAPCLLARRQPRGVGCVRVCVLSGKLQFAFKYGFCATLTVWSS